jgi:hypothetical protein
VTFHLFFLSNNYELQLNEYLTIWKRIFWGLPFAVGLGIVLGQSCQKKEDHGNFRPFKSLLQAIFVAGIAAPTFIYLIRFGLIAIAVKFGWKLPEFLLLFPSHSSWHIPKMAYVFFCLPALALACGQIIQVIQRPNRFLDLSFYVYAVIILAVLIVFYLENTKNGFAYASLLVFITLIKILVDKKIKLNLVKGIILISTVLVIVFLAVQHFQQNASWKTLISDLKVAQRLDEIDAWKDYGARGYPLNDMGVTVSETNYMRAAWSQVVIKFIIENPLGYGLVFKSFGSIAKEKWPESRLDTSHSAWLDLTIGLGVPGVFLILLSGLVALINVRQLPAYFWKSTAFWLLISITLLMITTEISRKGYVEALIFLILWSTGLGLNVTRQEHQNDVS